MSEETNWKAVILLVTFILILLKTLAVPAMPWFVVFAPLVVYSGYVVYNVIKAVIGMVKEKKGGKNG